MNYLAQAINTVQAITDPEQRFHAANDLDDKLLRARTETAEIKRAAVEELRRLDFGYQRIATVLGLSKARIQQITKTPPVLRVYAIRDEDGRWYPEGADGLLGEGAYEEGVIHFQPANADLPLAGQKLVARYGQVDAEWSLYTVRVRHAGDVERAVGTTVAVHEAMVGA